MRINYGIWFCWRYRGQQWRQIFDSGIVCQVFFWDRTNPLTELDDVDFHSRFRMNKRCFCNLLDRIELELRHATESHCGVFPIQQLVVALQFYASAWFFVSGGMHFRVFYRNKYKWLIYDDKAVSNVNSMVSRVNGTPNVNTSHVDAINQ